LVTHLNPHPITPNKNKNRSGSKKSRNSGETKLGACSGIVPIYRALRPIKEVFRFYCNSTVGDRLIYRRDLLNLVYATQGGVLNSTGVVVYQSVLLEKISITATTLQGDISNNYATATVAFPGPYAPDSKFAAQGNASKPAKLTVSPPNNSFAALWSTINLNENEVLFMLDCTSGAIIELFLQLVRVNGDNARTVTALSTITSAAVWYNALDNSNSTGTAPGSGIILPYERKYSLAYG